MVIGRVLAAQFPRRYYCKGLVSVVRGNTVGFSQNRDVVALVCMYTYVGLLLKLIVDNQQLSLIFF